MPGLVPAPPPAAPRAVAVGRVFQIDFGLIIKLAFAVFLLSRGGGEERLAFLIAAAIAFYLYLLPLLLLFLPLFLPHHLLLFLILFFSLAIMQALVAAWSSTKTALRCLKTVAQITPKTTTPMIIMQSELKIMQFLRIR